MVLSVCCCQVHAVGEPFYSYPSGCTLALSQHSVYTDKSSWKFNGSCEGGVTFELLGLWRLSENKAYESIKGTGASGGVEGSIVANCSPGVDPWLNNSPCSLAAMTGNFANYYKVYAETSYPLSAGALTSAQKSALRAEAQANGKEPTSAPPPPPSEPKKELLRPESAKALGALAAPRMMKPTAGASYHNNIPVQVSPAAASSDTKVNLEFQVQDGSWVTRDVVSGYDTAANPSGITVSRQQLGQKGDWRVRAKMASPGNAPWSGWVQFKLQ
jgi:hypothetical protein